MYIKFPGADVVLFTEGNIIGCVTASAIWTRRGLRPWHVNTIFTRELDWLRISGEPLYAVMYEIPLIVRETPEHIRVAERWQVPNKLADRSGV